MTTTETDPAEVRAWLRDHGHDVPDRGRIPAPMRAAYDAEHAGEDTYDAGTSEDDFTHLAAAEPGDGPPPAAAGPAADGEAAGGRPAADGEAAGGREPGEARAAERAPRPVRARQAPAAAKVKALFGGKPKAKAKPKARAKQHAWVRTDRLIEHFWSQLAWAARPMPPMQKILAAQAPMAGVILQDAARDTVVDRVFLQPAARVEDKLEAANAMIGPPLWVGLITAFGGTLMMQTPDGPRPIIGPDGVPVWDDRTRVMVGGLRFSLMSWLRISGKHADEIREAAEELTQLGQDADQLIAWIFQAPQPGQSPGDIEEEARQRGQEFTRQAPPAAEREPEQSSAFRPAPTLAGNTFAQFDAAAERAARGE